MLNSMRMGGGVQVGQKRACVINGRTFMNLGGQNDQRCGQCDGLQLKQVYSCKLILVRKSGTRV